MRRRRSKNQETKLAVPEPARKPLSRPAGPQLSFGDDDDVAELLARSIHALTSTIAWDELPPRSRSRKRNRTKRWLNTAAADRMTPARLAEVDADADVIVAGHRAMLHG